MALSALPLSYCANVHPGRTFAEVAEGLKRYTAPLRERLGTPIAVGMWMTRDALTEVATDPKLVDWLQGWLREHDLTCYTMNAFPFGNFHAERVKENVYLPDWTDVRREEYTRDVADLLARLLPEGVEGSLSTSPCAFKALHPQGADVDVYFPRLVSIARHLQDLRRRTGRTIRLAIEPEPGCLLETTDEALGFFKDLRGWVKEAKDADAVREHLGLCYDICHQAVEFEDVAESIDRLDAAEIRLVKVHVTCALELTDPRDEAAREHLARFVEPRYLHQTTALTDDGRLLWSTDLSREQTSAPAEDWLGSRAWRIHFHVPVHEESLGPLGTTRHVLDRALRQVARLEQTPHLEVETYTWNVLPTEPQNGASFDLVKGLSAELQRTTSFLEQVRAEQG
ncbi:Xylose isomerase-like TIM barrel [Planctomycetes bacterium Pan216]|uniref:Xylose isomerase-like TIM barrel n=1 Tax=Kolteria novifilia TaxID=2527975 RepID=A0A518B1J1_9BACT|nr:Xylose isomerase-like TIM barrel [Planctomycetes bacterium Pan216]